MPAARVLSRPFGEAAEEREKFCIGRNYGLLTDYGLQIMGDRQTDMEFEIVFWILNSAVVRPQNRRVQYSINGCKMIFLGFLMTLMSQNRRVRSHP